MASISPKNKRKKEERMKTVEMESEQISNDTLLTKIQPLIDHFDQQEKNLEEVTAKIKEKCDCTAFNKSMTAMTKKL